MARRFVRRARFRRYRPRAGRSCSRSAPSLVACRTIIGKGAPNKQGSHSVHGAALGADEIAAAREYLGWTAAPFEIPADILANWRALPARRARPPAPNGKPAAAIRAPPNSPAAWPANCPPRPASTPTSSR
jgi:transketolase